MDEGLLKISPYTLVRSSTKDEQKHLNQLNQLNRQRMERASSLALPHHDSLLDFYDKQQEECNSVALLPPLSSNMVVRRHSSHYYPYQMDETEQHFPKKSFHQLQSPSSTKMPSNDIDLTFKSSQLLNSTSGLNQTNHKLLDYNTTAKMISNPSSTTNLRSTFNSGINSNSKQFNHNYDYNFLPSSKIQFTILHGNPQRRKDSIRNITSITSNPTDLSHNRTMDINTKIMLSQCLLQNICNNSTNSNCLNEGADLRNYGTNIGHRYRPPSPLPLTMDEKHYSAIENSRQNQLNLITNQSTIISAIAASSTSSSSVTTTAITDYCFTNDIFTTSTFCQDNNLFNSDLKSFLSTKPHERSTSSFEDRNGCIFDNGDFSDDDRFSGENSVFESELSNHSTPIKYQKNDKKYSHISSGKIPTIQNSLNSNGTTNKRMDRSSCSTVDSSMTSSGYGTHSERLTSSSTCANVEYRSRVSSVDTECSLDSCSNDLPEKTEKSHEKSRQISLGLEFTQSENVGDMKSKDTALSLQYLPQVPARKLNNTNKDNNQVSKDNSALSIDFSCINSSVSSSSTSASSTTSTGSSILSTGSSVSVSGSGSMAGAGSGLPLNIPATVSDFREKKRPDPPTPPTRHPNSQKNIASGNSLPSKKSSQKLPSVSQSLPVNTKFTKNSNKNQVKSALKGRIGEPKETAKVESRGDEMVALPAVPPRQKLNNRQDSTISSDSFSQTSSPGFNSKNMEIPLLPVKDKKRSSGASAIQLKQKYRAEPIAELDYGLGLASGVVSPLTTKSSSNHQTQSLQTIVRFQNGNLNTMPLSNQKHSNGIQTADGNSYNRIGRYRFRLLQLLVNILALMIIAGSLTAYFHVYPTVRFINKTIINTVHVDDSLSFGKNPAPGTCLPIIVKFCQGSQIPYNFTVFPNYIGHFGQLETQVDLDAYEALVDVRCYELVSLFLCTLFVPKCGTNGATVPPCKSLCLETMRRCGFFFDVFGLNLPEYLNCKLFKDFESSEDCVGFIEVQDVMMAAINPQCNGFQCDHKRCLPLDYVCDGHLDCMDQTDEASCPACAPNEIYCGQDKCVSSQHICDGIVDCPYGQDERNCMRLSGRNGDLGTGILEVYRISHHRWTPACVKLWDRAVSPMAVCSMLGYNSVNATTVITQKTHRPLLTTVNVSDVIWKTYAKHHKSILMQELSNCTPDEDYPIAELTCSNFECGKIQNSKHHTASRRIIGGARAQPGNWPFLAAILGGPEKIFYCAGVLISDQWVLTASHCIGNHTIIDLEDWTIQLGITRRDSFTYSSQRVKVKAVIPHPLYNIAIPHDNDIALFQLATRVAFHEQLLPVCLPPPSVKLLKPDTMCTVIGWGKREDKNPKATYEMIVNEVQVPIIRRQLCDNWLDNLTISDGMICAGFENGGRDACQGDSGGPLLCPYPGEVDKWFVGGIVSWGIMCAHPKLPGVYANVIKYVPWIQEQMQKHLKSSREEKPSKYDSPPGGPNILSNLATVTTVRKKKPFTQHPNQSPQDH